MLSFFSKKKQSPPDTPPNEVIPGPEQPAQENNGDDFIFIEKKPGHSQNPPSVPVYPPMPPAPFGLPYPMSPYQRGGQPSGTISTPYVPYIQGVPFELAPELSTSNSFDAIQMQVDGILALMTRQISVDELEEYNFALERSVQSEEAGGESKAGGNALGDFPDVVEKSESNIVVDKSESGNRSLRDEESVDVIDEIVDDLLNVFGVD